MAPTYSEDAKKTTTKNEGPCPSGFYRDPKTGKCVKAGFGPEYRP